MRIGLFPEFKGGRHILLTGTAPELRAFSAELNAGSSIQLHSVATVSLRHPVQSSWTFSASDIEKLKALSASGKGHQYFDLAGSDAALLVSVGEYDDAWWGAHG